MGVTLAIATCRGPQNIYHWFFWCGLLEYLQPLCIGSPSTLIELIAVKAGLAVTLDYPPMCDTKVIH